MTAVAAAIVAAFLAGAIALFRERLLEARRLRVAARILESTLALAYSGASVAAESDSWEILDETSGKESFRQTWEKYGDILAGHLKRPDWELVESAVTTYLTYFYVVREGAPNIPPFKEDLENIAAELRKAGSALHPFCD